MSQYLRVKVLTVTILSLLTLCGSVELAHAAPQLKTIEHWGVVQMPTEYAWPGRGPVTLGRIKLLTEIENKSQMRDLSFSVLVVTQKYIDPWDAAGELHLIYKKKKIFTLDLTKQESWLKVSEAENTAFYMLNVKAGDLRLPLSQLLDMDIVFSPIANSKLVGEGMPRITFGIFDKTMQVTDVAGNQYVTDLTDRKLDPSGVSGYFGVSMWNQSKSERKRLTAIEKEEAKYTGKNVYLKQRAEIQTDNVTDDDRSNTMKEKNTMGYIKSKTRNGMYDVEFISGSDGKLPINLVSFSKVK
jgi:hypothetical protein